MENLPCGRLFIDDFRAELRSDLEELFLQEFIVQRPGHGVQDSQPGGDIAHEFPASIVGRKEQYTFFFPECCAHVFFPLDMDEGSLTIFWKAGELDDIHEDRTKIHEGPKGYFFAVRKGQILSEGDFQVRESDPAVPSIQVINGQTYCFPPGKAESPGKNRDDAFECPENRELQIVFECCHRLR